MKVIVLVYENDLMNPQVFGTVDNVIRYWSEHDLPEDEEYDIMIDNLRHDGNFADATSWIGWVEVQT